MYKAQIFNNDLNIIIIMTDNGTFVTTVIYSCLLLQQEIFFTCIYLNRIYSDLFYNFQKIKRCILYVR